MTVSKEEIAKIIKARAGPWGDWISIDEMAIAIEVLVLADAVNTVKAFQELQQDLAQAKNALARLTKAAEEVIKIFRETPSIQGPEYKPTGVEFCSAIEDGLDALSRRVK